MNEEKLVSIAVLKARAGMRDQLRRELIKLIEPTRHEPGNLDYVLFELRDEPGTFYMREAFVSQAALDSHCQTDYFQALPRRLSLCLQSHCSLFSWMRSATLNPFGPGARFFIHISSAR